ncbi:MAG: hypothetical protein SWO11_23495 [Thermodesulfobacteriota bacterium]|nr:hypothetical protein [Thermodesulfobacteriota bacterium]
MKPKEHIVSLSRREWNKGIHQKLLKKGGGLTSFQEGWTAVKDMIRQGVCEKSVERIL